MIRPRGSLAAPSLGAALLLVACAVQPAAEPVATSLVDLPRSYRFEPEVISVPDGTTVTGRTTTNSATRSDCSTTAPRC